MTSNALSEDAIDQALGVYKEHVAKLLRWLWSERGYRLANAMVTEWAFRGVIVLQIDPQPIKDQACIMREGLTDILTLKPSAGKSRPELTQLTVTMADCMTRLVVAVHGFRNSNSDEAYEFGQMLNFMHMHEVGKLSEPLEKLRSALEEIS